MRYIRIPDGIYEYEGPSTIVKIYPVPKGLEPLRYADGTLQEVGDEFVRINKQDYKVSKQRIGDTIEELCDEFVLVNKYRFKRPKTATELEKDFDEMIDFYDLEDDEIYGCIWIKGKFGEPILKPVGKLNRYRRSLELL